MHRRPIPTTRGLTLALGLGALLAACDDSTGPDDATLVGVWSATSISALGTDFVANGMVLTVTLDDSGTYTFEVENDLIGVCDPDPDCSEDGTYTSTDTQITLDPGTEDEVTFNYTITGSTMTWGGSLGGVQANLTFTKQ